MANHSIEIIIKWLICMFRQWHRTQEEQPIVILLYVQERYFVIQFVMMAHTCPRRSNTTLYHLGMLFEILVGFAQDKNNNKRPTIAADMWRINHEAPSNCNQIIHQNDISETTEQITCCLILPSSITIAGKQIIRMDILYPSKVCLILDMHSYLHSVKILESNNRDTRCW